ncbi:uncharacterized protein LOC126889793 [Diabrotica virgifera virgifera]|uniref:DNA/RNA non-specific endonuclease/pyrophosphatase/phosphodiesterase domain-containing protein n=1 Tax=Diabrotica virgifera virgifera TaxID=50390 RepID=A0ABM5KW18_DIAVI|nr:uncharacterized protein LOC126889793 [Diabrotica virgifera virgifera]
MMEQMKTILLFLCFSEITQRADLSGCTIYPIRRDAPFPINPTSNTLLYPRPSETSIRFAPNTQVEFSCPESNVIVRGNLGDTLITATCEENGAFKIPWQSEDLVFDYSSLKCTGEPIPTVRKFRHYELKYGDPNINCHNKLHHNLVILKIGFRIDSYGRYLDHIDICFDTADKIPVYSHYNISAATNSRAKGFQNPYFIKDESHYELNSDLYQLFRDVKYTVNNIVGLNYDSNKYINQGIFINKGHLAAKADFVYESLQKATFRFINIAPQWDKFNAGNWNEAEINSRNYAHNRRVDLQVWTGTYGHSVLPHEITNEPKPLYLHVSGRNSPSIRVPGVFWKLLYEPVSKRAIILVGHNNPYEAVTAREMVCDRDVSSQVNWLYWDKYNLVLGYSYACEYDDRKFQSLVSVLPPLEVTGLLY